MVVSSASRGGGRSLRLFSVSLVGNRLCWVILSLSWRDSRVKYTMLGSCLGEKKFEQQISSLADIQFAKILHLRKRVFGSMPGSLPILICLRYVSRRAMLGGEGPAIG